MRVLVAFWSSGVHPAGAIGLRPDDQAPQVRVAEGWSGAALPLGRAPETLAFQRDDPAQSAGSSR